MADVGSRVSLGHRHAIMTQMMGSEIHTGSSLHSNISLTAVR